MVCCYNEFVIVKVMYKNLRKALNDIPWLSGLPVTLNVWSINLEI